ncbi:MAG: DNA polymerase IV [Halococcoides sp.]
MAGGSAGLRTRWPADRLTGIGALRLLQTHDPIVRDGQLPGVDTGTDRIVAHVDMDCFYAACERLREPALDGEPVVVGMGYEPGSSGGVVATASYEARAQGIESAQPIETALDRLPRRTETATGDRNGPTGFYRPVDLEYYEQISDAVMAVLQERADTVRAASIDEAYLDVTDRTTWAAVESFARDLRADVSESVGVTASVGVAPTMSAAKIASDRDKPDGLVIVPPDAVRDFLADIDVAAIHEVGPKTARTLRARDIETAGDLASADPARLESLLGERGRTIRRYARGDDDRPVEQVGDPKSLSRQSSFGDATDHAGRVHDRIDDLARAVAERSDRENALYRTIGIRVVTLPFDIHTRERTLPGPVADEELLCETAHELAREFDGRAVRKVGVRVSNLAFSDHEQAELSGYDGDGAVYGDGERTAGDDEPRRPPQRSIGDFRDGDDQL